MSLSSLLPFWPALLGGVLIGAASLLASGATGKITGISGILARIFRPKPGDTAWRVIFLVGLITGAGVAFATLPAAAIYRPLSSLAVMAGAGVLVGLGTRIGGGCTSGHGVCGIGLGSKSAILATLVFILMGMLTVWLVKLAGGAAS